ncbi:proline--tRNA ligase [Metallosphaera tengchongensis]|uniref:Proline--tRNA ligase n=1 Tax=Metallosphaera tengchongensis TaxID=1532350 RepID=A0A6N0NRX5_9CREN|nr:proline--tRNA ligase [Metallosphaera tengchongensis]QKQ99515.1 proline--tRNA ligase [Metallosphaera tengchongensis]
MKISREKWSQNFSQWFDWVLSQAEFYDYGRYPVKGTGVWMPYGFKLRQNVIDLLRSLLDQTGHEELLFPLLIPEGLLKKESEHIRGFEREVFWVTQGGEEKLEERFALRPTSEVSITFMESLWIKGYTQLPRKFYQIVSVFRYETKATRPLIRVRELTTFKEAHTLHETYDDAARQVNEAVEIYSKFFDALGIPYLISKRPEWDKFAGAEYTIALDTIMPDGRALQIGTAHHLGQHFTKAMDYKVQRADGSLDYPHQTSYGVSDRVIATVISINGDDHGPILPPLVAPIEVVIIPIPAKNPEDDQRVLSYAKEVLSMLRSSGVRATLDDSKDKTPGEKYYVWELKGVPIRIEIGMREVTSGTVFLKRRDTLESKVVGREGVVEEIRELERRMSEDLKARAWKEFREKVRAFDSLDDVKKFLETRGGIAEVRWCGSESCGLKIEEETNSRVLGAPLEPTGGGNCVVCGKPASNSLRIAKTY